MVQIVLYPAWRMIRMASNKATFIVLTMELCNASSGGMARGVSITVSLMMTTSTGITHANLSMEVKCADLVGKGQAVSIDKRTERTALINKSYITVWHKLFSGGILCVCLWENISPARKNDDFLLEYQYFQPSSTDDLPAQFIVITSFPNSQNLNS